MKLPAEGVIESLKRATIDDPIIAAGLPTAPASDMDAPDELGTPSLVREARQGEMEPSGEMEPLRQMEPKKESGKKTRVSLWMEPEDAARARSAWNAANAFSGTSGTFSEWATRAIMDAAMTIEKDFNGGQPFPGTERLSVGRPRA